jgi:hypothetical protein
MHIHVIINRISIIRFVSSFLLIIKILNKM